MVHENFVQKVLILTGILLCFIDKVLVHLQQTKKLANFWLFVMTDSPQRNFNIFKERKLHEILPWVPEPRNLDERKLVKRKREEENFLSFLIFFFLLFFGSGTQGNEICARDLS